MAKDGPKRRQFLCIRYVGWMSHFQLQSYGLFSPQVPTKRYNFDWAVKDDLAENDFAHEESRDGDHTRGSYSVLLPDGRVQTVTYYVNGDSGYVAEVTYEGSAQFPSPKPAYRRVPAYG